MTTASNALNLEWLGCATALGPPPIRGGGISQKTFLQGSFLGREIGRPVPIRNPFFCQVFPGHNQLQWGLHLNESDISNEAEDLHPTSTLIADTKFPLNDADNMPSLGE